MTSSCPLKLITVIESRQLQTRSLFAALLLLNEFVHMVFCVPHSLWCICLTIFHVVFPQAGELPREPLQSVSCRRRQNAALQKPLGQLLLTFLGPGGALHNRAAWNHTRTLCTLQTFTRQVCVCAHAYVCVYMWPFLFSEPFFDLD